MWLVPLSCPGNTVFKYGCSLHCPRQGFASFQRDLLSTVLSQKALGGDLPGAGMGGCSGKGEWPRLQAQQDK